MKDIKKIDIHAHAIPWPQYTPKYMGTEKTKLTPEELFEQYYARLNVKKCVLLPGASPEGATSINPPEVIKYMVDRAPERLLWFCGVDPRQLTNSEHAPLSYLLEHYKALGARGLGELTCNLPADDKRIDNLFACCAALDLPVTIHIAPAPEGFYGIYDELGLPRIEKMLKKHPRLKLFGHSQPFWSEIGCDTTEENRNTYVAGKVKEGRLPYLLRKYENLYCDLSAGSGANALMRDREYAAKFIAEFSDRLMYGCDICMPGQEFPFRFDEFLTSMRESGEISEENYYKIVRGNAERILRI